VQHDGAAQPPGRKRHRTGDRPGGAGGPGDWKGRCVRTVFEPLCWLAGLALDALTGEVSA